jgi:hypothetical protein
MGYQLHLSGRPSRQTSATPNSRRRCGWQQHTGKDEGSKDSLAPIGSACALKNTGASANSRSGKEHLVEKGARVSGTVPHAEKWEVAPHF